MHAIAKYQITDNAPSEVGIAKIEKSILEISKSTDDISKSEAFIIKLAFKENKEHTAPITKLIKVKV